MDSIGIDSETIENTSVTLLKKGTKLISQEMKKIKENVRKIPVIMIMDRIRSYIAFLQKLNSFLKEFNVNNMKSSRERKNSLYTIAKDAREGILQFIEDTVSTYNYLSDKDIEREVSNYLFGEETDKFIKMLCFKCNIINEVENYKKQFENQKYITMADNYNELKMFIKKFIISVTIKDIPMEFIKATSYTPLDNTFFLPCHQYGEFNISHIWFFIICHRNFSLGNKLIKVTNMMKYNYLDFQLKWQLYYFHNTWKDKNPFPSDKQEELEGIINVGIKMDENKLETLDEALEKSEPQNDDPLRGLNDIKKIFETDRCMDHSLVIYEKSLFSNKDFLGIKFEDTTNTSLDSVHAVGVGNKGLIPLILEKLEVSHRVLVIIKNIDETFFLSLIKSASSIVKSEDISKLMSL